MSKFNYYKRVVNGQTIELHLHENRKDYILAKKFPESEDIGNFKDKEFIEIDGIDKWLDEGLKVGIFNTTPIPTASST